MNEFKDNDFIALSSYIEEMANIDYYLEDLSGASDLSMKIDRLQTETACQLMIQVDEDNRVQIGAIPPMYYVETTIMPVFHKINLDIVKLR